MVFYEYISSVIKIDVPFFATFVLFLATIF